MPNDCRAPTKAEIEAAVASALAAGPRRRDPFRPYLQFLTGLIGFSALTIVGLAAALTSKDAGISVNPAVKSFGGVFAWMAITALVATVAALVMEAWRSLAGDPPTLNKHGARLLCVLPALSGLWAVLFCVRGGTIILNAGVLPSLAAGLRMLIWPW